METFLGESQQDIDHRISVARGQIEAARNGQTRTRGPSISLTTNGTSGIARAARRTETHGLEERYNFEDALAMGMFLNSFFRHADIVKMANLAQLVNVHRAHLHQ